MDTKRISYRLNGEWNEVVPYSAHSATNDSEGKQINVTYETRAASLEKYQAVDESLKDKQPATMIGAGPVPGHTRPPGRRYMEVLGDDGSAALQLQEQAGAEDRFIQGNWDFRNIPSFGSNNLGSKTSHIYIENGQVKESGEGGGIVPVEDGVSVDGTVYADRVRIMSGKGSVPEGDGLDDAVTHREIRDIYGGLSGGQPSVGEDWVVHVGDTLAPPEGYDGATPFIPADHMCHLLLEGYPGFGTDGNAHYLGKLTADPATVPDGLRFIAGRRSYITGGGVSVRLAEIKYTLNSINYSSSVTYTDGVPYYVDGSGAASPLTPTSPAKATVTKVTVTSGGSTETVTVDSKDLLRTGQWIYKPDTEDPLLHEGPEGDLVSSFHPDFDPLFQHRNALDVTDGRVVAAREGTGVVRWTKDGQFVYVHVMVRKADLDVVVFDGQSNIAHYTWALYTLGYIGENPPPGTGFIFGYDGFSMDMDWVYSRLRMDDPAKYQHYHHWARSPYLNPVTSAKFVKGNTSTWPAVIKGSTFGNNDPDTPLTRNGYARMCDMVGTEPIDIMVNSAMKTKLGLSESDVIDDGYKSGAEGTYYNDSYLVHIRCDQGSQEGPFAKRWNELTGHKVYVINLAAAGREIDWHAGTYLEHKKFLLEKALEAIPRDRFGKVNFLGTIWLQGEGDSHPDYKALYTSLRSELLEVVKGSGVVDTCSEDDYISLFWSNTGKGLFSSLAQREMCGSDDYPRTHLLTDAAHYLITDPSKISATDDLRIKNGHTNIQGRTFLGHIWAESLYSYKRGSR